MFRARLFFTRSQKPAPKGGLSKTAKIQRPPKVENLKVPIDKSQIPKNGATVTALLKAHLLQKDVNQAQQVLSQAFKDQILIPAHTYNLMLTSYKTTKDHEASMNLFNEMKARKISPNSQTIRLLLAINLNQSTNLNLLLYELQPNLIYDNYATVIGTLLKKKTTTYPQIQTILSKMKKKFPPQKALYTSILKFLSEKELPKEFLKTFSEMKKLNIDMDPAIQTNAITFFAKLKNPTIVESLISELVNTTKQKPTICALASVIDMYAKLKEPQKALSYLNLLENSGYEYNQVILTILSGLFSRFDLGQAEKYFFILKEKSLVDLAAVTNMIGVYHRNNQDGKAIELWEGIGTKDDRALGTMLVIFSRIGDFTGVSKIYEQMKAGDCKDEFCWSALINFHVNNQDLEMVEKITAEMRSKGIGFNEFAGDVLKKFYQQRTTPINDL